MGFVLLKTTHPENVFGELRTMTGEGEGPIPSFSGTKQKWSGPLTARLSSKNSFAGKIYNGLEEDERIQLLRPNRQIAEHGFQPIVVGKHLATFVGTLPLYASLHERDVARQVRGNFAGTTRQSPNPSR